MSPLLSGYKYRSPFGKWDTDATLRGGPRRSLLYEEGKEFFTPELVPVAQHPEVIKRDLSITLRVERLYDYHDGTAKLEYYAVNPVAQRTAHDELGVAIPSAMRADAHKVYCDEGYHELMCTAQVYEVEAMTGIAFCPRGVPPFLQCLYQIKASVNQEMAQLAEIGFVVVSETLITGSLTKMAKDARVVTAVREVVADHQRDEARHSAHYAQLFECVWPQLSRRQQEWLGPLLGDFILAFLTPDYTTVRHTLAKYGLPTQTIARVLEEAYAAEQVFADIKQAAHATLRLFERQGVFDAPRTAEAFAAKGLLPLKVQ